MSTLIERRVRARTTLRKLAPGYGTCGRCETPWSFTKSHSTTYEWQATRNRRGQLEATEKRGMFPLCEDCWQELGTTDERLPYYLELVAMWDVMGPSASGLTEEHLRFCLDLEMNTEDAS